MLVGHLDRAGCSTCRKRAVPSAVGNAAAAAQDIQKRPLRSIADVPSATRANSAAVPLPAGVVPLSCERHMPAVSAHLHAALNSAVGQCVGVADVVWRRGTVVRLTRRVPGPAARWRRGP
jgi:hypothetical protein